MARGPRLVLLGKQGAGKGTQATRLADHYGIPYLSTGELFRQAIREGSEAGIEADRYVSKGDLVPDDIVTSMVRDHFGNRRVLVGGFVFDGFPRTVTQAEELDEFLNEDAALDAVIDLNVSDDIVMHRLAGRRVCENCGANYHVDNPPKNPWECDVCGGRVVQRTDDSEESIKRRLQQYHALTVPMADYYKTKGLLVEVDGVGSTADVFDRLIAVADAQLT